MSQRKRSCALCQFCHSRLKCLPDLNANAIARRDAAIILLRWRAGLLIEDLWPDSLVFARARLCSARFDHGSRDS